MRLYFSYIGVSSCPASSCKHHQRAQPKSDRRFACANSLFFSRVIPSLCYTEKIYKADSNTKVFATAQICTRGMLQAESKAVVCVGTRCTPHRSHRLGASPTRPRWALCSGADAARDPRSSCHSPPASTLNHHSVTPRTLCYFLTVLAQNPW